MDWGTNRVLASSQVSKGVTGREGSGNAGTGEVSATCQPPSSLGVCAAKPSRDGRVTVCLAAAAVVTHRRVILFPIGPKAPTLCPQWLSQALLHLLALLVPPSSRARLRSRLATKAPNKCMEQPKICSSFLFRVPAASRPAVQLVFGLPGAPPAPERAPRSQQHLAGGTAAAGAGLHTGWVLLLQSRISCLFFTSEWSASDF